MQRDADGFNSGDHISGRRQGGHVVERRRREAREWRLCRESRDGFNRGFSPEAGHRRVVQDVLEYWTEAWPVATVQTILGKERAANGKDVTMEAFNATVDP